MFYLFIDYSSVEYHLYNTNDIKFSMDLLSGGTNNEIVAPALGFYGGVIHVF